MDVVPAPAEGWEAPPFSGEIKDGYVWGRGSQDMKSQMIAALDAIEFMLANGTEFKRGIYCCFGHDEELATFDGMPEVTKYLKSQNVEFEYVLDEGGAMLDGRMMGINGTLALIGTCEKGYMDVVLTASKPGGHASTPASPTVLAKIGKALVAIESNQMKARWTGATKDMFKELAPHMNPLFKFLFVNRDILSPLLKLALILVSPVTAALIRTTFAPTMAKGSDAANVLPPAATATVNCRILPGDTTDSVVAHIQKVVGKDIDVSVPIAGVNPCPVSPINSEGYRQLVKSIKETFPGLMPAPFLFIAATDSKYLYPVCDNVYRFTPFMASDEDRNRIHALNERCPIDALLQATEFYVRLITNTCL
jgi:carboxypeptidase PM20D1